MRYLPLVAALVAPFAASAEETFFISCGPIEGSSYYYDLAQGAPGWASGDKGVSVEFQFNPLDVFYFDGKNRWSITEDRGVVEEINRTEQSYTFIVLYPAATELLTLVMERDGLRLMLSQHRNVGIVPKAALFTSECGPATPSSSQF